MRGQSINDHEGQAESPSFVALEKTEGSEYLRAVVCMPKQQSEIWVLFPCWKGHSLSCRKGGGQKMGNFWQVHLSSPPLWDRS